MHFKMSSEKIMGALGQYIFASLPIVMKPNKVIRMDVVIGHNVSGVVTSEDRIGRIIFLLMIIPYLFKSTPVVIKQEYFLIKLSEDNITQFLDGYHKALDENMHLKRRSNPTMNVHMEKRLCYFPRENKTG